MVPYLYCLIISSGLSRINIRLGTLKNLFRSRSLSEIKEKRPIVRAPVHSDAIGALATVRPGIVLSGGRDKVHYFNDFMF